MRYYKLPLDQTVPWYEFRITLSSVRYTLTVRYNPRMDRWIMDVGDAAGAPIALGLVLLNNRPLLSQYVTLPLPPGPMAVLPGVAGTQPGLSAFLTDHMLVYGDPNAAV